MFKPRIKIDSELFKRLEAAACRKGYSSTDEFILHVLEHAAGAKQSSDNDQQMEQRLRGLGYIE